MLNQEAMVVGVLSLYLTGTEDVNRKYEVGIGQRLSLLSTFVNHNLCWAH